MVEVAGRSAGAVAELDECVDRHGQPVVADDERVDVDARDVGSFDRQPSEPDQQIDDTLTIHLGIAPERPEELLRDEVVDHLGGRRTVERGRPEHDVGDGLGEDPADAEHHRRSELGIAQHAGDQLAIPGHHRGDEQRHVAVGRQGRAQQLGGGVAHGSLVAQPEAHEATFGLVGDRVAAQLHDDREPDRGRRGGGLVGARHVALVGERQPESGQQSLRGGLRQSRRGAVEGVVIARNGSERRSPDTGTAPVGHATVSASGRQGGSEERRARGRGAAASVSGASAGASSRPSMNGASEK